MFIRIVFYLDVIIERNQSNREVVRRSASRLLACAVQDLFPNVKLIEGDQTDIGFYYDFIFERSIDASVLPLIEERMRALIHENLPVKTLEMMRENAVEFFRHRGQEAPAELLSVAQENIIQVLQIKDFYDLCSGSHITKTGEVKAFKLYQLGSGVAVLPKSGEQKVVRIKGTAFESASALKQFLKTMDQAQQRDHRRLGKELDLFETSDLLGAGFWLWHPKGAIIRELLLDWWRVEHRKARFLPVATPRVVKPSLLEQAGWYDSPGAVEGLFPEFAIEGSDYMVTPTTTPLHMLVFRARLHSYRELPVRYAECGNLYYCGKRGQLKGMFKARAYLADDAHIFCTPDQLLEELISSLQFIDRIVRIFDFQHRLYYGVRRGKYARAIAGWDESAQVMVEALRTCGFDYEVDDHVDMCCGPYVKMRLIDALGREWDGPSVGLDFCQPERFGLRYQGPDDEMHMPLMITRSTFGSLERFVAILVEHFAGYFPLWLSPEQVRILPVAEENFDYANAIGKRLDEQGFRIYVDHRRETLKAKVRAAECAKVPYAVVVGDQEEKKDVIAVRRCKHKKMIHGMRVEDFLQRLYRETENKVLDEEV